MELFPMIRIVLLVLAGVGTCLALADDDDDNEFEHRKRNRKHVAAPANPVYKAECGSCHMLYPPGLLPARSWTAMLEGLKDHFGENASLDAETTKRLTIFLSENAADRSDQRRSRKIAQSIARDESPRRFTETYYFKRQHHELGPDIWKRKSVGSPANCVACHGRAEAGIFSEEEIRIPK